MNFRYERQVDFRNPRLPWTSRPIVRVRLSFGDRRQAVLALIDSGADITLFHISLAKTLGIEHFEREGRVYGISGEMMPIYYHKLKLQLDGTDEPMEIEAGFVDSPGVGALLGQSGFLEHFRICFDRRKEEIEIRPAESAS
jgi:hypothetical protein